MNMKRSKVEEFKSLLSWSDEDMELFVKELKDMMETQIPTIDKEKRNKVSKLLTQYGFANNLKGYEYLRDAIVYCVEHGKVSTTKVLYPELAKKYSESNVSRVERAIRHSIERAFNNACPDLIELFGYTINHLNGKPTNSAFIALVSNYIREGLL